MKAISVLVLLAACGVEPDAEPIAVARSSNAALGFARISAGGGVLAQSNSASGAATAVTVAHPAAGSYTVTFAGLGTTDVSAGMGGNAHVTAYGFGNVRCRLNGWSGWTDLAVSIRCTTWSGAPADSGFAVAFFRYTPSSNVQMAAYTYVQANSTIPAFYDYNAGGGHNVVNGANGWYTVHFGGFSTENVSLMLSSFGTGLCSIGRWWLDWDPGLAGDNVAVEVLCNDTAGNLVPSAFSLSVSQTGPTVSQQGAHGWFSSRHLVHPHYADALGRADGCAAAISGSLSAARADVTVTGDYGSWDASPFVRVSFVSDNPDSISAGDSGTCKIELLSHSGTSPSTTSTTSVRCYDQAGAVVPDPMFAFTELTSDVSFSGACP